jgi:hypothetical protein
MGTFASTTIFSDVLLEATFHFVLGGRWNSVIAPAERAVDGDNVPLVTILVRH